jgi:hypothetical protein
VNRNYVFAAETSQEKDNWIAVINALKQKMMDLLLKNTLAERQTSIQYALQVPPLYSIFY